MKSLQVSIDQHELTLIRQSSDTQWLMSELKECLKITVYHVIKLAAIVRRLEECGCEIEVDFSLLPYIRKVAYEQVVPELIVSLQGDQQLLSKAASLPIPEQRMIAENKPLKVMEIGGDHRKVPPLSMTRREIRQVFGRDKIRSDAEQIGWLRDEQTKAAVHQKVQSEVLVDQKKKGIVVNGTFVSAADLAHYLAELTPRK